MRNIVVVNDIGGPLDVHRLQMISMDPPRHDRLNELVGKAFTPKRIAIGDVVAYINAIREQRLGDQETLDRLPAIELDGRPERIKALLLNQHTSIPVRLRP